MSFKRYDFLRVLRTTALTSLVCLSSSAVYAMVESEESITFRTTVAEPHISVPLEGTELDFDLPLEIKIAHRSPGKPWSYVSIFDPKDNEYVEIEILRRSLEFIKVPCYLDSEKIRELYSSFEALNKPMVLQLRFHGDVSDIHSIKLIQRSTSGKNVLRSVILGNKESEEQAEKAHISLSEAPNVWSEPQTLMPTVSFSSVEPINSMTSVAIEEIRSLERKAKKEAFKKLIEDTTVPFSDRLNVVVAAADDLNHASIPLLYTLMRDPDISSSDRLKVAKVGEQIEEGAGVELLCSIVKDQTIPFSYRFEVAKFLGEPAFFKLARDSRNKPEERALATEHLQGAMKIIATAPRLEEDGDYTTIIRRDLVSSVPVSPTPASSSSSSGPAVSDLEPRTYGFHMGKANSYPTTGFSAFEGPHRWTLGKEATIDFSGMDPRPPRVSFFDTRGLITGSHTQNLTVRLNGEVVDGHVYKPGENNHTIDVALPKDGPATIKFEIPTAKSPSELGINPDTRELGISFREVKFIN